MDGNNSGSQPDRMSIGIEQETTAVTFDGDGNSSVTTAGDSIKQNFDGEGEALTSEELAALEDDASEGSDATSEDASEGDDQDKPEDDGTELPEWDGDNEDVVSSYEGRYITKDDSGADVLNFEAFNAEFAKDRGEGKRDLNAGTRKFLKDRFGISDSLIDQHLQGVLAQEREFEATFYTKFGSSAEDGKANYDAMFEWAKSEGYSEAQKKRFNEAVQKGGDAAEEQFELLKTRYLTKHGSLPGGDKAKPSKPGIGLKRGTSPKKSATSGASSGGSAVQPFANAEEHRLAQNEALKLTGKDREAKLSEVRARLSASTFWRA